MSTIRWFSVIDSCKPIKAIETITCLQRNDEEQDAVASRYASLVLGQLRQEIFARAKREFFVGVKPAADVK